MWTKQFKETALQLAQQNKLSDNLSAMLQNAKLSLEQKTALNKAYGSPRLATDTGTTDPYWL